MNREPATHAAERARIRVRGLVQGVGFRPFVFGLAERHGLTGWVRNDDAGVLVEVQGPETERFVAALGTEAPPLARIDAVELERVAAHPGETGFAILPSDKAAHVSTAIGADAAPCDACLRELFDPTDRHYRYAFVNCTHCGPRFTITRRLPYDRAQTSMASFTMCDDCAREYHDPRDRRFHAQPVACPRCGPRLSTSVEQIVADLLAGRSVAIKGVGGYQIACDARSAAAVDRLRRTKERGDKPFAVLVANVASARRLAAVGREEASLLASRARPIVLLPRRLDGHLAAAIAPGLGTVGLVLPASPLHWLLFHEALGRPAGTGWLEEPCDVAFVMTSANRGGEPLVVDDADARALSTAGIVDGVASHDRTIEVRADDPVVRVVAGAAVAVRRGRGQVPEGIALARGGPCVLGVGGFLKNAVCVTRGDRAFLSQHVGDLDDGRSVRFFEETIAHLCAILEVEPVAVAHDLHPDFASTGWAEASGLRRVPVQHHHAHVAAVLAEHGRAGPALGLALDGTGLGTDGTAWGGELLALDGPRFERVGHLAPLPMPGGDRAAREPWRMAAAALFALGRRAELATRWGKRGAELGALLERNVRCPAATGLGRWFDAAAGLLGVCERAGYEGEAPMRLESLVRTPRVVDGGFRIDGGLVDLLPLLDAIRGMDPVHGAEAFHGTVARALVELALPALTSRRLGSIAVGGGCAVNAPLVAALVDGFRAAGIEVLLPARAPAGDGGLALGQAWVAQQVLADPRLDPPDPPSR